MKKFPLSVGLALAALVSVPRLVLAADAPAAAAATPSAPETLSAKADAQDITNGYNIKVEVKVNEKGEVESLGRVETDEHGNGDVLTKMALVMAARVQMPVREKDGKPVKYTAIMPFHFPIEGDEGPASQTAQPRPIGTGGLYYPVYPEDMAAQNIVGGVVYELTIDTKGDIARLTTLRASHPQFDEASRKALAKWKFKPAVKDGQPVETRWRIAIVFETDQVMADIKWRVAPRPSLGTFFCLHDNSPRPAPEAAPAGQAPAAQPAAASDPAPTVQVPATTPGK